jgi:hypothetical protein
MRTALVGSQMGRGGILYTHWGDQSVNRLTDTEHWRGAYMPTSNGERGDIVQTLGRSICKSTYWQGTLEGGNVLSTPLSDSYCFSCFRILLECLTLHKRDLYKTHSLILFKEIKTLVDLFNYYQSLHMTSRTIFSLLKFLCSQGIFLFY